jgi:NADPH2:quinone reductase
VRAEYEAAAQNLFDAIAAGVIRADTVSTYPLTDAAKAHADIEARRTSGSVLLIP